MLGDSNKLFDICIVKNDLYYTGRSRKDLKIMLNNVNVKLSKIRVHPFQDEWNRPNVNRVI